MKILQLCHKPPLPLVDGGCIGMHNLTDALLKCGQEVKVLAIETPKHPVKMDAFPIQYLQQTRFESVFIDTTPRLKDAVKSLLRKKSYQISRFYSKSMESKLIQVLRHDSYDIVQLESIYVIPYISVIRKYSKAKIVIRLHNIEHQIWERLYENEKNLIRKLIYYVNSCQLQRVERQILHCVDGYMPVSTLDHDYFCTMVPHKKGFVVPFCVDLRNYEVEGDYIPSDEPTLFHLGSMNWLPNVEGVEWFLDEIWPSIHNKYPSLIFKVAGFGIPDRIAKRDDPNVQIVGAVEVANQFMLAHDIMIVPLLSGSGVRVKIVEAMALGKVVISTTIGADGLSVENGKHLFIADTLEEFLAAMDTCITTPDICSIIGENARDFVSMYHNSDVVINNLLSYYQQVILS